MANQTIHGNRKGLGFWKGRGIYAVLACCLLGLGGASVAILTHEAQQTAPQNEPATSSLVAVEKKVTDQPDKRTTTTTVTTTAAPTTAATQPTAADLFVLPMGNTVQKPYSGDTPVYSVTLGDWRTHTGTDFSGEIGQSVRALADGTVAEVGEDTLWGEIIKIDHGSGVYSVYHGVHATVASGSAVSVGQDIGTLSEIPCEEAQGPHLHLELQIDTRSVDPVATLGREVCYESAE